MNVKPLAKAPVLEALVLAAGRGSRFGGAKLLAPWRGGVLLDGALAAAFAAPARRVTLLVGADGHKVETAAQLWAERRDVARRLTVLKVADWADGLSASLKAGVVGLTEDVEGVFVFLGDMPRVPVAVLAPLASGLAAGAPAAAPVYRGELGNPALIGADLFPTISRLSGDRGARAVLMALGSALVRIEAPDDGVLFDVDTPQALAQA